MASSPLVLPGVLFVGEDERQRITAHTGPAAGWMVPKGILDWSSEVSVVAREDLTEDVRRDTKAVMPEEQIPAAKYPLTSEAAKRSPLVAVSSKLSPKLAEKNVRVHTIGIDRMTSSFFYIAEGGTEDPVTVSGDYVQAVAEMLGDRADNAAIERVLDSLIDRLVRALTKDRVTELALELAAALPRAASDGSGAQGIDLDAFEKDLAALVGRSEKYTRELTDLASKIGDSTDRKVDVPLYGDARRVPAGPFELTMGDRKVSLGTYERWVLTGPFTEPAARAAAPATSPKPKPVEPKAVPSPKPKPVEPKATTPASKPEPAPAKATALAPPIAPPRPASERPAAPRPKSVPDAGEIQPTPVVSVQGSKVEAPPKAEEPKPEPKAEEPKPEPKAEEPKPEPKVEAKPEPKAEAKPEPKSEPKPESEPEPRSATKARDLAKEDRESKPEVAANKGGFPWIAVLVVIAVAIVVYQLWLSKH